MFTAFLGKSHEFSRPSQLHDMTPRQITSLSPRQFPSNIITRYAAEARDTLNPAQLSALEKMISIKNMEKRLASTGIHHDKLKRSRKQIIDEYNTIHNPEIASKHNEQVEGLMLDTKYDMVDDARGMQKLEQRMATLTNDPLRRGLVEANANVSRLEGTSVVIPGKYNSTDKELELDEDDFNGGMRKSRRRIRRRKNIRTKNRRTKRNKRTKGRRRAY
jgi:hypothetical protein